MAYVNVAEWTPEHVAEWLRGLEDSVLPYVHFFLNNDIDGHHLLNLSPDDLNKLHIFKIGHQELILEAVDLLRQLHYGLTSETLQFLALKLGCKSRSLYSDLKLNGPKENYENSKQEKVSTDTLSSVSDILVSVKSLISWLDRYPFAFQEQYVKIRRTALKLSIELASTAQRDQFAEKPHVLIKNSTLSLAELCDRLVQEFNDSLIIQPASLDIATVKKKPDEELVFEYRAELALVRANVRLARLGIHIQSTYSGVHIIGGVKPQSPTTRCAKVEEGDEIVQVNYQTVVGWQLKKLVYAMREYPSEIHLTLKKRPRHTNILGQVIILRPYRIPSKKTAFGKLHKWSEGNSSLHIQDVYSASRDNKNSKGNTDDDDDDDSAFLPDDVVPNHQANSSKENALQFRMFSGTSHATVQRRATVSGASPTVLKAPVNIEDLVNGVPSIKRRENISRSVSHDPSKTTSSGRSDLGKPLESIRSDDSEENFEKISFVKKNKNEEGNAVVRSMDNEAASKVFADTDLNEASVNSSVVDSFKRDKSSVQTSDILVAQEEDYVILENKSLEGLKRNGVALKTSHTVSDENLLDGSSDNHEILGNSQNAKSKLANHTGNHSVSNASLESDGILHLQENSTRFSQDKNSQMSPILTREALKLCTSSQIQTTSANMVENQGKSYQVVVIGGVPQKFVTPMWDGRRGSDFIARHQRKKISNSKFGSRRISCRDLGVGDRQGWLKMMKQKDKRGFFPAIKQWRERWTVLKSHYLYCYRDQNNATAECLIFLPGSTVSPAPECKNRKHCFRICQQAVTFYFAAETLSDLTKWMNKMGLAAIAYNTTYDINTSGFLKPDAIFGAENTFYSETDDSDDSCSRDAKLVNTEEHSSLHDSSSSQSSSERSVNDLHAKTDADYEIHEVKSKHANVHGANRYHYNSVSQCDPLWSKKQIKGPNVQRHQSVHPRYNSQKSRVEPPKSGQFDQGNEVKCQRISYNRSFSCTETTSSHLVNEKMRNIRKSSCDDADTPKSLPCQPSTTNSSLREQPQSPWLIAEDEYDILTSSLGRQKPIAKEISPGLVARMAVSYSNLSHGNAVMSNSAVKHAMFKGTPAPGYVAKISDSFDHWARKNSSEIPRCYQLTKSQSSGRKLAVSGKESCLENFNYSRSTSETHMAHNIYTSSHKSVKINSSQIPVIPVAVGEEEGSSTHREKQVSVLDREYYRLYGRKKVSQSSSKSPGSPSVLSEVSGLPDKTMKFFPDANNMQEILPGQIVSNVNLQAKYATKDAGSEKFTFSSFWKAGDVCDSSVNAQTVTYFHSSNSKTDAKSNHDVTSAFDRGTSENALGMKNSMQLVFDKEQKKKCSNFSEGIENIGFCSPDQMKPEHSMERKANVRSSSQITAYDNIGCSVRQATLSAVSMNEFFPKNDNSTPSSSKSATLDLPTTKLNSAFKLFGSPKFMKKLSSPKLDKKNIFKSKKQAKEVKKADQKEIINVQTERKFFGSPRLARAIFGSPKTQKKAVLTTSSSVQTDLASVESAKSPMQLNSWNKAPETYSNDTSSRSGYCATSPSAAEHCAIEIIKSSSNSSLNSDASSSVISASTTSSHYYVETRIKPQITISLPFITDKCSEDRALTPDTPRTPIKPTMGIAMLGKRRLPSVSGESSLSITSSKGSHDEVSETLKVMSEIKMEIGGYNDDG